jgi:hypothetical protein
MATKATDQLTLIDITDGYSAGLTSESFTFVGGTSGVSSGATCSTDAFMFCGSQQCTAVTIGTITCPTGISSTITNNGTSTPTITFKTTATVSAACEATIPVTADGITINKKFSFAVAKTGATGSKGDSVTISSQVVDYQVSTSGTTVPTGTWSTTIPTVDTGKYLWTRTTVTYNGSNGSTVSYAVSYQGTNGTNGTNGTSPTVSSTKNEYQQSSSGTTVPTGTWSTTPPTATAGQYMWTKTTVTYSDSKTAVSYTVSKNGSNGSNGANAIRVEITSNAGNVFKNNSGSITLTAHVYSGATEATISTAGAVTGATTGTIKWYKGDPGTDSTLTAVATAKTLTVSASDVLNAQVYTCQLE